MDDDYLPYEEGSWDSFDLLMTGIHFKMARVDTQAYIPSPQEIDERCRMIRWLNQQGFKQKLIYGVMQFDHPGFALVRRLTAKHGPREAERRLMPFLEDVKWY